MKLWIGKEKEGFYKGLYTLFVGSSTITAEDIFNTIETEKRAIQQVYFGAGRCTTINYGVVKKLLKKHDNILDFLITLEIDINELNKAPKDILSSNHIEWIITINNTNFNLLKKIPNVQTQLKMQSVETKEKCLYIASMQNVEDTNIKTLEGKTYKGDKIIK